MKSNAALGRGYSQEVDSPERRYAAKAAPEHRKRFGQFFTPPQLASLMADWICCGSHSQVLDPAMGTGVLTRAVLERSSTAHVTAYEIDQAVASYSPEQRSARVQLRYADYMHEGFDLDFDAAILNPPYIRHREMLGYDGARAQISAKSGYVIPKSANLYVYFVMKSVLQVRPGGRIAALIPTEWMNANFADSFKQFLLHRDLLKEIVLFSGCSNIFEDALTTASVLLLEVPA
jgi:type I restriction-modification system DNA methylase subunit